MDSNLIKETKIYKLSTQSNSGVCLNQDKNFKSIFQYNFPYINLRAEEIEYVYVSVPYVSLPVSFYNIDYQNNRLDMMINTDNGVGGSFSNQFSYVFKSGNYNTLSFMTEFRKVLGSGWDISIDNITNCFTIVNTVNSFISFQLLSSSTISSVMGFSSTITSTPSSLGNVKSYITLPRTCNFLGIPRIHIRCKELANSFLISTNTDSNILVSVPNDSIANGKIVYRNFTNSSIYLELPFLQSLTISFTDEQNNLINFNGISSYFEIQLDIYKKRLEKPPTFRQVIQELSKILK